MITSRAELAKLLQRQNLSNVANDNNISVNINKPSKIKKGKGKGKKPEINDSKQYFMNLIEEFNKKNEGKKISEKQKKKNIVKGLIEFFKKEYPLIDDNEDIF